MKFYAALLLFSTFLWASDVFLESRPELFEKKHRTGQWVCTKEKALKYVRELNCALDSFIEIGYMDYVSKIVSQTATYSVLRKTEKCGCLKQEGCLAPDEFWPCLSSFKFTVDEVKYQKNGVVVISGTETIYVQGKLWFEGKVYRYYVADFGCEYKLEMVLGTDKRCRACKS